MNTFILEFTTGEKFRINKQEAELIASAKEDQSITLKRLGIVAQKRMCLIYPEHSPDRLEERRKQQYGRLHDGTKVRRHFGQWVMDSGLVPDDNGNYQPVSLDRNWYPEIALDVVATEQEFLLLKEARKDYYEFLGIDERIGRIENNNPSLLKELF